MPPSAPIPNRPGYRPPAGAGSSPNPLKRKPPVDPDHADPYDPFAVLDQQGGGNPHASYEGVPLSPAAAGVYGQAVQRLAGAPGTQPPAVKPEGAGTTDTDAAGGLHTTGLQTGTLQTGGLTTGPLSTGNLNSGAAPAATGNRVAVVNTSTAGGGGGRSRAVAPVSGGSILPSGGSASAPGTSDGSTYVAVPQHDASGRQTGWNYVTPDQANWQANFGHLPGTASHPTQADPNMPMVVHPPGQGPTNPPPTVPTTHTVGAGETAFFNGQPVAPGGSVTVLGQHRSVVTAPATAPTVPTGPALDAASQRQIVERYPEVGNAGSWANTQFKAALPPGQNTLEAALGSLKRITGDTPAAPASPIAQTPTLPAPNFPAVPQPVTAGNFQPGTLAAAPTLALNTGAPPTVPTAPPLGSGQPIPASTVAGSGIRADEIVRPQAPSTPGEVTQNDVRAAGFAAPRATLQPTLITPHDYAQPDPEEVAEGAAATLPPAHLRPPTNPPTPVLDDTANVNSFIGSPDYRSQRAAPAGLMTTNMPGSLTPAKPPTAPTSTATATPLPGEPGGSGTAATANAFATPKPFNLTTTVPTVPTIPATNPDEEGPLKKRRLAGAMLPGN